MATVTEHQTKPPEAIDRPLIYGNPTFQTITQDVSEIPENSAPKAWWIAFGISVALSGIWVANTAYLIFKGIGIWGSNNTVSWAWDITNFIFWVGIGHAGTLISAALFLFRQKWRTSINRFAEASTIFAVICALTFVAFHTGRQWLDYWLFPLPNQMHMWANFISPLMWDVFAANTYLIVSMLFWYVGLIPDLATLRDRATPGLRKYILGFFAMGWRGGNRQWKHYERAYMILAGLSTPLVFSVSCIASSDFATSLIPGWHTTIFPPYFVAGAVFSGFATVVILAVLARIVYPKMADIITIDHLEKMNIVVLVAGLMVGYVYACEFFIAWYSGNEYEASIFIKRATGPYAWAYWSMIFCNVFVLQLFWIKKLRTNLVVMFVVSIFINIGMWFERFVITVTSLATDFLPSSWKYFTPTIFDVASFVGSIGLFMTLFLLFLRWLPMVAISEVKGILPQASAHWEGYGHHNGHSEGHNPRAGNGNSQEKIAELETKNGGH